MMRDMRRRVRALEEHSGADQASVPTLADFYGHRRDLSDPRFAVPLAHFYGGRSPEQVREDAARISAGGAEKGHRNA